METIIAGTNRLLQLLGHGEAPFGLCYSDEKPEDGYGPKPGEIFTHEREAAGLINWHKAFSEDFSCLIGNLWKARQKGKAAWISHRECGCMGGGYYAGMYRPWLEMNIHYVSTGIPQAGLEGEHYLPSPEAMRAFMAEATPPEPSGQYCVLKPLPQHAAPPLVVIFFARPEALTGLMSLVFYAAGHHQAVVSPFGAGCTNIIAWPLAYQAKGIERAVLGGFDPSARKFLKADELTLALPLPLYRQMLAVLEESSLTRHTWQNTRKRVGRSRRAWDE